MERELPLRFAWLAFYAAVYFPLLQYSAKLAGVWIACCVCITKFWYEVNIFIRTLPRDLGAGYGALKGKRALMSQLGRSATVAQLFTETAATFANKVFMTSKDSTWTFGEAREFTNRVANHFRSRGLKAGDEISLLMENRPEFLMIWLGLSKIGVRIALINFNLKSIPLAHCINAVKTKAVIFGNGLAPALNSAYAHINNESSIEFYHLEHGPSPSEGPSLKSESLLDALQNASTDEEIHKGSPRDPLLYIFTSGTTGLPKAAIVTNQRYMYCASNMFYVLPFNVNDKLYLSLPLYHNSGGTLGPGPCIIYGTSCHIASKFSASNFWSDCKKYNCTVALYIGEMVRYLLAQPKREADDTHIVRMLFGHGARKQLWNEFQGRFKVPHIREIYGSTEGNAGLVNTDNTPGAVGFLPTLSRFSKTISRAIIPMHVIKVDPETGKPIRNDKGFCVECQPNEPGELVGLITSQPAMKFEGYVDKEASKKKVYTNVFKTGETAFATGDIVIYDDFGYVFFQDRTGDTFRWKGENVSTNEVESVIAKIIGLVDAIVYGVEVQGTEGKAGMVAILNKDKEIDLQKLFVEMDNMLPAYAVPLFVRLTQKIESTTTLKYKKNTLVEEGFNPAKVKDPLFFLDRSKKQYVQLDVKLYDDIVAGKLRL